MCTTYNICLFSFFLSFISLFDELLFYCFLNCFCCVSSIASGGFFMAYLSNSWGLSATRISGGKTETTVPSFIKKNKLRRTILSEKQRGNILNATANCTLLFLTQNGPFQLFVINEKEAVVRFLFHLQSCSIQ